MSDTDDSQFRVWTGIIRDGNAYITDEPNCADECFGIHNSPEGPVDCDGQPI